jgi:uncharacterized cupin superfamily protein
MDHVRVLDTSSEGFIAHDVSTVQDVSALRFNYGGPGEVKWLRHRRQGEHDIGPADGFFLAHIFRAQTPCQFVFFTHLDESLIVLDGEAIVASDKGPTVVLRKGAIASFAAAQTLTFTVESSFTEFVTVAG